MWTKEYVFQLIHGHSTPDDIPIVTEDFNRLEDWENGIRHSCMKYLQQFLCIYIYDCVLCRDEWSCENFPFLSLTRSPLDNLLVCVNSVQLNSLLLFVSSLY